MKAILKHMQLINIKRWILAAWCIGMMFFVQAQFPGLQWMVQGNSPTSENIQAMAVDNNGNTIFAIRGNAPFSFAGAQIPHVSLLTGISPGATLIKLDPNGNVLWHRSLRGPWQLVSNCGGIDIDEDNNIYVVFNAISDVENATPIGGLYAISPKLRDNFLVKISPDGEGIWYKIANPTGDTSTPHVKVAPDGSVYSMGYFSGSVNLDGSILENTDASSQYITKRDIDGNLLWAKKISGENGTISAPVTLAVGSDGSVYITGFWRALTLQVDDLMIENELAFTNNADRWICRIAPDGTAQWLAREHSVADEFVANLAVSPQGELLVISRKGEADLHVGNHTLSGSGVVLSRYSASGEVISATLLGGAVDLNSPSVASNSTGSYYVSSSFNSPTYTLGGIEVSNMGGSTGTADAFVAKINAEGEAEWIYTFGNEETERADFIASSGADGFVVSASYNGSELSLQGTTLVNTTNFLMQYIIASFSTALNTRSAEALQQLLAYPNPFSENVQFDADVKQAFGNATLVVFNTQGVEVYRKELSGTNAGQINLGHLPKGAYIARLSDGKRSLHTKIIKQ